eukprot:366131-Chlamydomonas_euryale.AAC.45
MASYGQIMTTAYKFPMVSGLQVALRVPSSSRVMRAPPALHPLLTWGLARAPRPAPSLNHREEQDVLTRISSALRRFHFLPTDLLCCCAASRARCPQQHLMSLRFGRCQSVGFVRGYRCGCGGGCAHD